MVFLEVIQVFVAMGIAVLKCIQTMVTCPSCKNQEDQDTDQVGNEEIYDTFPIRGSLLKKSFQTAFAIKVAVLLLGLLAIVFVHVGYDISSVLKTSRNSVLLTVVFLGLG